MQNVKCKMQIANSSHTWDYFIPPVHTGLILLKRSYMSSEKLPIDFEYYFLLSIVWILHFTFCTLNWFSYSIFGSGFSRLGLIGERICSVPMELPHNVGAFINRIKIRPFNMNWFDGNVRAIGSVYVVGMEFIPSTNRCTKTHKREPQARGIFHVSFFLKWTMPDG